MLLREWIVILRPGLVLNDPESVLNKLLAIHLPHELRREIQPGDDLHAS